MMGRGHRVNGLRQDDSAHDEKGRHSLCPRRIDVAAIDALDAGPRNVSARYPADCSASAVQPAAEGSVRPPEQPGPDVGHPQELNVDRRAAEELDQRPAPAIATA